jgi:hypothetical protein
MKVLLHLLANPLESQSFMTQALEQKSFFAPLCNPLESQSFMTQALEQKSFFALHVDIVLLHLALLL